MEFTQIPLQIAPSPPLESYVIAEVLDFTDTVVDVVLPEYGRKDAIIPTSEIKVKRGKRVGDYVKKGKDVVAQVIRVDEEGRLDLSLKVVTKEDEAKVRERYAKAQKVHSIVCTAASYNAEAVKDLYAALGTDFQALHALFEAILVREAEGEAEAVGEEEENATHTLPSSALNEALLKAIHMRMQIPSYTVEKEVVLLSKTVEETEQKLNALVEKGCKVYVTAPPKYKITVTAPSIQKAEHLLSQLTSPPSSV